MSCSHKRLRRHSSREAQLGEPAYSEIDALRGDVERYEQERRAIQNDRRVITCAFCGHEYPPGTPSANHAALAEHVEVCPKHPATKIREERDHWRSELRELRESIRQLADHDDYLVTQNG